MSEINKVEQVEEDDEQTSKEINKTIQVAAEIEHGGAARTSRCESLILRSLSAGEVLGSLFNFIFTNFKIATGYIPSLYKGGEKNWILNNTPFQNINSCPLYS